MRVCIYSAYVCAVCLRVFEEVRERWIDTYVFVLHLKYY